MTTLITGATGFVGSAVLRAAVERGVDARVLARPGSDRRNLDKVNSALFSFEPSSFVKVFILNFPSMISFWPVFIFV